MDLFFVISLPRTGTTSICSMANICGLNAAHGYPNLMYGLQPAEYNFYSDVPWFSFSVIEWVIQWSNVIPVVSGWGSHSDEDGHAYDPYTANKKFIYIERDVDSWYNSWKNSELNHNYNGFFEYPSLLSRFQRTDFNTYKDAFGGDKITEQNYKEKFLNHREKAIDLVKKANLDLLIYKFSDGWEPFCDFIKKPVPDEKIPHQNIGQFGDAVITKV